MSLHKMQKMSFMAENKEKRKMNNIEKVKEIISSYLNEEVDNIKRNIFTILGTITDAEVMFTNETKQWGRNKYCDKLFNYYKEHNLPYKLNRYSVGILSKESVIALLYLFNKCKSYSEVSEECGLKESSIKVYRRFLKNAGYITQTKNYVKVNDGVLIKGESNERKYE